MTTSELKTLNTLAAWNITGTDAATALDTFIVRAARHIAGEVDEKCITYEDRDRMLTQIFGSDAVRVAYVLMGARVGHGAIHGGQP